MEPLFIVVIVIIILAIIFDFINGFHDASNIVATMIASRSISPEAAIIIASVCEFLGPLLLGTAVAKMIGKGIVDPAVINVWIIAAALLGAIIWNLITWWKGLPSSSSHALVGGLIGAVLVGEGFSKLHLSGIIKIVMVLITSPLIGLVIGFIFQKILMFIVRGCTPGVNNVFKYIQRFSAIGLAMSHGANDAQKSMGIITMILVTYGYLSEFAVPMWVIVACALAISLGTATGGWSIIKTVGAGIYKLRPVHSFSAQSSSAMVILLASHFGFPVSTTHIVSSCIMGVGSSERIKAVKWYKAGEIVITWFLTIPAAALVAAAVYFILVLLRNVF